MLCQRCKRHRTLFVLLLNQTYTKCVHLISQVHSIAPLVVPLSQNPLTYEVLSTHSFVNDASKRGKVE